MFTETIYGPTVTNNVFTNNEFTMVPITTKDTLLQIHFDSYLRYFCLKAYVSTVNEAQKNIIH